MKITFVIYGLGSGGAERAVTGLANHWVSCHDISILTLVKTKPFYPLDPKINLEYCLEDSKSTTNILQSLRDGLFRIKRVIEHLRKEKSEVVISFMTTSNIYTIWAAKWVGIPCIVSERSNHAVFPLPKKLSVLRNYSYKFCTLLIVQTIGNKNFYESFLPSSKIRVLPNAVATSLKKVRKTSLKHKERIILNVGSFKNGKAQDLLIKAFAKIAPTDWRLVFVGGGPNLNQFKKLATEMNIAHQIDFEGQQKDIAQYYNKAGMFVFTSEHEGFPNALLEALYFGIPTISTNCPHGPADLIKDGVNGFLVPVGNQDALQQKMRQLMKDEGLRKKFSSKAITMTKRYEMEHIAKHWMNTIVSVTHPNEI